MKQQDDSGRGLTKLWLFLGAVAIVAAVCFYFRDSLSLQQLGRHERTLVSFREANPAVVYLLAFLLYVAVTGLTLPPGAAAMSLMYAWFFGFWRAVLLISFASTAGATIAFLLSRYLIRDAIQARFGDRLTAFNEALEREGAFYLFSLRLIPAVPFFVINLVMGLTPMRARTFWWISQLGMLPGTCVYVYAGSEFPSLQDLADHGASGILKPQLLVAFALLGLFPIVIKKLFSRRQTATQDTASEKPTRT